MIQFVQDLLKGTDKILVRNLVIFHTLIIAVSNYLSTVRLSFLPEPIYIFSFETNFPFVAALLAFPIVVIGNDITMKILGGKDAKTVLTMARFPAIIIAVLALLTFNSPHAYMVGLASIVAYGTSTLFDTYVVKVLKDIFFNFQKTGKLCVLILANIVQSYTFFYVAFYPYEWVHSLAFHMTIFKILISTISFIPSYKKIVGNAIKFYTK
jgi:uncharacterized PurR-regulated membrane protein YhhQ (DUF165 family)